MQNKWRRRGLVALAGVLGISLAYVALKWVLPLELAAWEARWSLSRAGVQDWSSGTLTGLEKDHCQGVPGCQCVAMAHGIGDDSLTWKRVLMKPRESWRFPVRMFAIDLPGSRGTPAPAQPEGYRARRLGEQIAAALRAQSGCDRWILVGNSFGGWVSVWAALSWQEGIRKLLLISSAGLRLQRSTESRSLLGEASVSSLKEFQARAYYSPRPLPEHVWAAAARRARSGNAAQITAAQTPEDDLDTVLGGLNLPTLVVWGEADRIISPEKGRALAQQIRGAQFRSIPRCGHMPQKECPEIVISAVHEMIRFGSM